MKLIIVIESDNTEKSSEIKSDIRLRGHLLNFVMDLLFHQWFVFYSNEDATCELCTVQVLEVK